MIQRTRQSVGNGCEGQRGEDRAGQSKCERGMEHTSDKVCPRGRPSPLSQSSCFVTVVMVVRMGW
jgi:hypothetical protein